MAAVSIGKGYAGIFMNVVYIVFLLSDKDINHEEGKMYELSVIYMGLTGGFMFLISLLYFVERRNAFSCYFYTRLRKIIEHKE